MRGAMNGIIVRLARWRAGLGPGPMSKSVDDLLKRERAEVARLQRKVDERARESFIEAIIRLERRAAGRRG